MRIVIAYDGSDHAKAAIDDLRRSGLPRDANAMVVSVGETLLPAPSPVSAGFTEGIMTPRVAGTLLQARAQAVQAGDEASALAHEGSQLVLAHFPRWGVYSEPVVGTPAQAVIQKARDWHADLILVGSHGRSALGRFVLGSVSMQVATESRCAVRVARHVVERGNAPVRIIIGVDGSRSAEAAVHSVASRAWPPGTEVRLVIVDDTVRLSGTMGLLPTAEAWVRESNDELIANARAMLEPAAEELLATGLQVSCRTIKGNPRDTLNDKARTWGADCIVVGAVGFNTSGEQARLGSVATALVTSAPCSVEVTRA
jgi:nucleotide-binding universal stress UspA family protein